MLSACPQRVKTPDSNCTNQILSQKLKNIHIDDKLAGLKHMTAAAQKKYPWALCLPKVPGGALVPVLLSFPRPRWSAPPLSLWGFPRASNTFYHQTFPLHPLFSLLNWPRFAWNKRNLTDAKNYCGLCQIYFHSPTQKSKCLA